MPSNIYDNSGKYTVQITHNLNTRGIGGVVATLARIVLEMHTRAFKLHTRAFELHTRAFELHTRVLYTHTPPDHKL